MASMEDNIKSNERLVINEQLVFIDVIASSNAVSDPYKLRTVDNRKTPLTTSQIMYVFLFQCQA
jgi:hypothetical protein